MTQLIAFFARRHLLSNLIFFAMIVLGAFTWKNIGKEEMPEFASNWIRVMTAYPGAPAEDVELFVTKPLEKELKGIVGIEEVHTTSSLGVSSIRIIIDDSYPDQKEVVQEIQEASVRAKLPTEVREFPTIRQFKSSEKAILDVGLYLKGKKSLDTESRERLQGFVKSFENQLLAKSEISSINRSNYLKPELQVIIDPDRILNKNVSLAQIHSQIISNHIRSPVGSLQDRGESKVSAINELETVAGLQSLILQGNFEGFGVKLADISSQIRRGHQRSTSIFKVNGHEAVFLNITKSISTDILTAQKVLMDFVETFQKLNRDSDIGITMMDDESYAVRNRLNIITSNGLIGFLLIVFVLFLFLDIKTGFWVAMGIPFSMAFTLIIASVVGYTVNNMTLAGIIIVLGIVVDDAIIIAENIIRKKERGLSPEDAAIQGTSEVFRPIIASILTTCVAFLPLLFFEGFFGKLVKYIPLIVILMLLGSLLESLFVLPAHISGKTFLLEKLSRPSGQQKRWLLKIEGLYKRLLATVLPRRHLVIFGFFALLGVCGYLFQEKMKFVMFPREESAEVFVKVAAPKGTTRAETSQLIEPLETFIAADRTNVVGVRSSIGLSRRGGEIRENEASILIEVHPADTRNITLNALIERWEAKGKEIKELEKVKFLKGRWGHGSGNAIEIQVQENVDADREAVLKLLEARMNKMPELKDVEVDQPLKKTEYILKIKQPNLVRLDVDPKAVTTVLRTFVEGSILYIINKGDEEVDVRLTVPESAKTSLSELLKLRVNNRRNHLVVLNSLLELQEVKRPVNIVRANYKRSSMVYANMNEEAKSTPLLVAEKLENEIFPDITQKFPNTILSFKGEIENSRESQGEFRNSIMLVILMIFLILAVMFNSLVRPLLIMSIVPFGFAGAVMTLFAHGMTVYGFFGAIGTLGMIGVVINDAIVMIDKIDKQLKSDDIHPWETITNVSASRLRPVLLTTLTTTIGILPTAYGVAGYDSMLAEMMLTMGWGLVFGTVITLILIPCFYTFTIKKPKVAEN